MTARITIVERVTPHFQPVATHYSKPFIDGLVHVALEHERYTPARDGWHLQQKASAWHYPNYKQGPFDLRLHPVAGAARIAIGLDAGGCILA